MNKLLMTTTLALALAMPLMVSASRDESQHYVLSGDLSTLCLGTVDSGAGDPVPTLDLSAEALGGGCFDVGAGDTSALVSVQDENAGPGIELAVGFQDADGNSVGDYAFVCDSGDVAIPAGAAVMFVSPTSFGVLDCDSTSVPTTGTVFASIT